MSPSDFNIFRSLLNQVYAKATGLPAIPVPLPEKEALTLVQLIEEVTNRTISEKTLRNYVKQAFSTSKEGKSANPMPFHLETLARYIMDIKKEDSGRGTPSWFLFRQQWQSGISQPEAITPQSTNEIREQKKRPFGFLLWLLLISLLVWIRFVFFKPNEEEPFREDFHKSDRQSLEARGWKFQDFDSAWFNRQEWKDSMLTLWTLPGDYWVKKGEPPQIRNMLVHKIDCDCFTVTAKIHNFYPYQNAQNISLFLFNKDLNRDTWFEYSFHYFSKHFDADGVLRLGWVYMENGENIKNDGRDIIHAGDDTTHLLKDLWLRLSVDRSDIMIMYKATYDWKNYEYWPNPVHISLTPAYIGIASFQGWTRDDGTTPKGADTIPVYLDELIIQPCHH